MFQQLMLLALKNALCALFGFCIDQEDCPDGVCDDVLGALDEFNVAAPAMAPNTDQAYAQSFNFDFQWNELQPLAQAAVAFLSALKRFLGIDMPVGG